MGPGGRREVPDSLVWAVLGLLVATPLLAWIAALAAGLVTSGHLPGVGLDDATRAIPKLVTQPGDPDLAYGTDGLPGPAAFWLTSAAVAVATAVAGVALGVRLARPGGRPGMARRSDLRDLLARSVAVQAKRLRPDLPPDAGEGAAVAAAGVGLGRHHPSGTRLYGTVEHSYAVIAPPRTGKTGRVVIPAVLDHDGPAVVTSTRWEVVEVTAKDRAAQGRPVWVFDADQSNRRALPKEIRDALWSPVAGCDDPQTAMIRARSLARAAGAGSGIDNGDFWATHATTVLQSYLHAAALDGKSIVDVRRWALDPTNGDAVNTLRTSPVAPGWAADLAAQTRVADRQRDGVWGVVQQSLAALGDPRFLQRLTPKPGTAFDPADLLDRCGTLFLVGRSETQDVVAPLVAALVEAIVSEARARAAQARSGRLCPPLLCALDEAANIAPLPTLPTLVADGGGSGITTIVVLQSRAQARQRWGEDAADAIIAACTHRIILGGGGELRELDDLARLVGERDEEIRSHSWQPMTPGGSSSTSTALRRVPIITPADLQALPKGRGVLCSPNAPPAEVALQAWWERPDADSRRNANNDPVPAEADDDTSDEGADPQTGSATEGKP